MKYQIDQSIKIENTQKASYVCLASESEKVLVGSISAKEKRILKLFYRKLDKPLIFKLFTFSVLCAKLIIKVKPAQVSIDKEYIGHERQIKSFIIQALSIEDEPEPRIYFEQVGKGSNAHIGSYNALQTKKADFKITSAEVLKYYEKTNKK